MPFVHFAVGFDPAKVPSKIKKGGGRAIYVYPSLDSPILWATVRVRSEFHAMLGVNSYSKKHACFVFPPEVEVPHDCCNVARS